MRQKRSWEYEPFRQWRGKYSFRKCQFLTWLGARRGADLELERKAASRLAEKTRAVEVDIDSI